MTEARDSQALARLTGLAVGVQHGMCTLDEALSELRSRMEKMGPWFIGTIWYLHDPGIVQSVSIGSSYPGRWHTIPAADGAWTDTQSLVAYLRDLDETLPAWAVSEDGKAIRLAAGMADFIEEHESWENTPGPGAGTKDRHSGSARPA